MSASAEKKFDMKYIHYAVVIFLAFFFRFIPPFGAMTPYGMGIIGCFLAAIYGWSTIDMFGPSLLALIGLAVSVGVNPVISGAFGNMTIMGMMFVFMVMGVATELGAIDWMVSKLLRNKIFMGKPWFICWFLLFVCYILGNFGAVFLVLVVCQFLASIFKQIDAEPFSPLVCLMFLGVAYCLMMGQIVFPYLGLGMTLVGVYSMMSPVPLDMAGYMMFGLPLGAAMTVVYVMLMRFVFRVDVSPFKNLTAEVLGEAAPITPDQKKALICLFSVFILNICSAFPFLGPVYKVTAYLTMFGNAIVVLFVMLLLKKQDGSPLFDARKAGSYISWDIILLSAFIMGISNYLTAAETGITNTLFMVMAPFTQFSPWVFIILVIAVGAVVTNFANNLVLTIALMPFMVTYLAPTGMDMTGAMILLFMTCQMALCTPGGSPMTAVVFSMTEWVKPQKMMKYGLMLLPLLLFFDLLIGVPLNMLIF